MIYRIYQLLLLALSVSVTLPLTASDMGKREYIPPYTIEKRTIDKTISKSKSEIWFTFFNHRGVRLSRGPVTLHANKNKYSLCPDTNGVAKITLKPGDYIFYTYAFDYTEIRMDTLKLAPQEKIEISVRFERDHERMPMRKPIIYLYPEEKTDVQLTLDVKGELFFTYPAYHQGWNVTAHPNGTIESAGKTYNYLFWEAHCAQVIPVSCKNTGYVVGTDTLISFMENSLTAIGLSSKEQQDFITYWYPYMAANTTNLVQFAFNEDCNTYATMNVVPAPDNVFRVYMIWSDAQGKEFPNLVKPVLPKLHRAGFTVVEWGGMEINPTTEPVVSR